MEQESLTDKDRSEIRETISHPELPVLKLHVIGDVEGKTMSDLGLWNGYVEDILRATISEAGRTYPMVRSDALDIFAQIYNVDKLAKEKEREHYFRDPPILRPKLPIIKYIPPQEELKKKVAVINHFATSKEEIDNFVALLKPETKFERVPFTWGMKPSEAVIIDV